MARLQSILDTSSAAMTAQPYRRCKPPQRRRSSAAVKRSKAAGSTPMQRATASIGVCTPGCLDMQPRSSTPGVMPFAAASRRHNESKDSPRTGRILAGSQSSEQSARASTALTMSE
jgi:hypothetical protein